MNKTISTIFILIVVGTILLAGCQKPVPTERTNIGSSFDYDANIKTNSFASEEEYISFIKANQGGGYYGGFNLMRGSEMVEMAFEQAMAPTAMDSATKGAGNDFSGTNNQVLGVDEGDILKTDGEYIYTITQNTLFIVKAYPGEEAEIISTIKFDERPNGLFIMEDKLAVFGNVYNNNIFAEKGIRASSGATFLNIYEISDKEDPELEKEYLFEGNYFNSRMIGEDIYLVSNLYPQYRVDYPTPLIIEDGVVEKMPVDSIHYFNIPYYRPSFVGIHSINIQSNDKIDSKMLAVEGSPNLYMSENNMYITYTETIDEWELQRNILQELLDPQLPDYYKEVIEKIQNADPDVLSRYEKQSKIQQIYSEYMNGLSRDEQEDLNDKSEELLKEKLEEYEYFEFTVINKVSVDDGDIDVTANGKAPGAILNQFSMDEYDDVFRIGTTLNSRWSRFSDRTESLNNVYTFDEDLEMLGSLEGLAEGERIFSTRFMGERLYMVTFRQVDPFFVIDLSDPKNPEELGELKIPGFSRYLHPYDENTIIGIGRDATATGRQQGLKISLFDVSDVKNPEEIAKFVSDDRYSSSTAEYEHKAFLFSKEKNLLVIPVFNYDWQEQSESYNGAFVFDIDKNDIELRGLIDHSEGNNNNYGQGVERSLYIEDLLYTKSPNLLRINELDDLSSVKNVKLDAKYSGEIPVY